MSYVGYQDIYRVPDSEAYARAHVRFIQRKSRAGFSVAVTDIPGPPRRAYLNHNRWMVTSVCNTGALVDFGVSPALARCFGCGGIYQPVRIPSEAERVQLDEILSHRHPRHRNWIPGESITTVIRTNLVHGLRVTGVIFGSADIGSTALGGGVGMMATVALGGTPAAGTVGVADVAVADVTWMAVSLGVVPGVPQLDSPRAVGLSLDDILGGVEIEIPDPRPGEGG